MATDAIGTCHQNIDTLRQEEQRQTANRTFLLGHTGYESPNMGYISRSICAAGSYELQVF